MSQQQQISVDYSDVDNIRRALFGFKYGLTNYKGWFDRLFEDYTLHPYLNLYKPDAQKLLYKKGLLGRLAPIFAKHLRITSLVNQLIGIDLLSSRDQGPSLVEDVANVLLEEQESRQTLYGRVAEVDKRLRREGRLFAGLANEVNDRSSPPLKQKTQDLTGSLTSIEGVLNYIDNVAAFDPGLAQALEDTGAKWILSDVPFFSMKDSSHHTGIVVAVLIDQELEPIFSKGIPFLASCGWYPYVTLYGLFREAVSVERPVKGLDLAWLKLKKPKFPDAGVSKYLDLVLDNKKSGDYGYHPFLGDSSADLLLLLSGLQLTHQAYNIEFSNASEPIHTLVSKVRNQMEGDLPRGMADFFS